MLAIHESTLKSLLIFFTSYLYNLILLWVFLNRYTPKRQNRQEIKKTGQPAINNRHVYKNVRCLPTNCLFFGFSQLCCYQLLLSSGGSIFCFSPGKRKSMADDDKSLTDTDQEKEVKKVKLEDEPADSKDSG